MTSLRSRLDELVRGKRERVAAESGFTLIELIVAMGVFSIFMVIFLAAVTGLARGTVRIQTTAQTTSDVLVVFQNLDRQIRYAGAINFPQTGPSGARYVEFRTPAASAASGVTTCTQWRFLPEDGRIESRRWPDVTGSTPTAWATKLTNAIDVGGSDYPFKLVPASAGGSAMQRLVLTIDAGNEDLNQGAAISTTFLARNSSLESTSNVDADSNGASDTPVCMAYGSRP